jgi:aminopeptidase YwaD
MKKTAILLLFLFARHFEAQAQDSTSLRRHIDVLCSKGFAGRGYVNKGMNKAAKYILQQFQEAGLQAFSEGYTQRFSFPVNTFPSSMDLKIAGRTLRPGIDYLVQPGSSGADAEGLKVRTADARWLYQRARAPKQTPATAWSGWMRTMKSRKYAYVLQNTDSLAQVMGWNSERELLQQLPSGVYILPKTGKPLWPVSQSVHSATLIELYDSTARFDKKTRIDIAIAQQFVPKFAADNIIAYVPGTERSDSFIVFAAHYDHLGKMGNKTMFPGASDNASGTAMLLELARHYAATPARYSMVFIAFAGEEAGLVGSRYFTQNPYLDLSRIRFLLNLDIMGDASEGITVVNAEQHPGEFERLQQLNAATTGGAALSEVRKRGPAANSDHHFFVEKGVPAFFIYTMGGKGFYHDIWDKPEHLSLKNIPQLGRLLKQFVDGL